MMISPFHMTNRKPLDLPDANKKADVAEHPEVFHHVGLLFNRPPGMAGLHFNESSEIQIH